jgi:hypothetical protein
MKLCKTHFVLVCLFFLATIPAYCQRGSIGLDVGQTSDKFGGQAPVSGMEADLEAQFVVIRGGSKQNWPSIVAGGEIRFPTDTTYHATEYAVYGGPMFRFGSHFSAGFHAQVRKIIVPPSNQNGVVFDRLNFNLLELPLVAQYKFGNAPRHAFIEAQVSPEFTPHYKNSGSGTYTLPHPNFDHGYAIRGSVGYIFGKWYAKATYETRYFKFEPTLGNPNDIYNWRTNLITGGAGFVF